METLKFTEGQIALILKQDEAGTPDAEICSKRYVGLMQFGRLG